MDGTDASEGETAMSIASIINSIVDHIIESDRRYREIRRIAEMDQQILTDIGLSRSELEAGILDSRKLSKGVEALGRRPHRVTLG
jgi:uncharacterized protein YjiS (DUF1127 family)